MRNLISKRAAEEVGEFLDQIKGTGSFNSNPEGKEYMLSWGININKGNHEGLYSYHGPVDEFNHPGVPLPLFEHYFNSDEKYGNGLVTMFCVCMYYHTLMYDLCYKVENDDDSPIKMIKTMAPNLFGGMIEETIRVFLLDMQAMEEFMEKVNNMDSIYMTAIESMEAIVTIEYNEEDPFKTRVKLTINIKEKDYDFECNAYQAVIIAVCAHAFSLISRQNKDHEELVSDIFIRLLYESGFGPTQVPHTGE